MTTYELMAIINPAASDDDKNSAIETLTSTIEKHGKVVSKDVWGDKKMAYKINGSSTGYYVLFEVEMDGTQIKNVNRAFNLEENVWRFMFVKKED